MMTRALLLVLLLLVSLPPSAQTDAVSQQPAPTVEEAIAASHVPRQLLQVANTAVKRGEAAIAIKAMERLVAIRPYNQLYGLQLAALYAENEALSKAFERLVVLQESGMAADLEGVPGLDNLRQYPLYEYLQEKMLEANEPHGAANSTLSLQDADFAPTGLAYKDGELFLASLRTGEVMQVSSEGEPRSVLTEQQGRALGAISALAMAADGASLWASVNDLPQHIGHEAQQPKAAQLVRLSLSGEVLERIALPAGSENAQLAGLAVASDGTVYIGDQARASVYRARSGDERMALIGAAPRLTSLRAITLVNEERHLLMADYALGLFLLDLETREPTVVRSSPKLNLGGIEHLSSQGQDVVAIQPGHSPSRVLRLKMSNDFSIVETALVQAKALPELAYPMRGVFTEDSYVLVANSYLPQLQAGGTFAPGERAAPQLMRLPKLVEFPQTPGATTPDSAESGSTP
jgi:hypothetical protein